MMLHLCKIGFSLELILSVSVSSSYWTSDAKEAEKNYVNLYGNDPHTSGKWKPFSRTRNAFPELLDNISIQAHELAGFGPSTASVRSSFFMRNKLKSFSGLYKTVTVDYIAYGLGIHQTDFVIPYLWYITKGLRPDCVFYLDKTDLEGAELRLTDIHVCGIRMPEWPSNVNYNESSSEYE